jgi:hypothetical protein
VFVFGSLNRGSRGPHKIRPQTKEREQKELRSDEMWRWDWPAGAAEGGREQQEIERERAGERESGATPAHKRQRRCKGSGRTHLENKSIRCSGPIIIHGIAVPFGQRVSVAAPLKNRGASLPLGLAPRPTRPSADRRFYVIAHEGRSLFIR